MAPAIKRVASWLRAAPWLNGERLAVYPKLLLIVYIAAYLVWALGNAASGHSEKPIGVDFTCFWAASKGTLTGEPSAVYDVARLHVLEERAIGRSTFIAPWCYPPMFLVVVWPLALLPYFGSLAIWIGVTLSAFLFVIYRNAPRADALWLAAAFPGTIANLVNGQNGLLTAALFGGALLSLESNPVIAGILFG